MRRGLALALMAAPVAALSLVSLSLAGCHKAAPLKAAAPAEPPSQSDYAAPPELAAVAAAPGGGVSLVGTAQPRSRVRLAAPDGTAATTTAGADGRWRLAVAAGGDKVRLYSLSEDIDGRLIRARGYVAMLPGAGAAVLRPATGARPLIGASRAPVIAAVDFDAGKAGVVAGRARPDTAVRVLLDGQDAGEGRSDQRGWFDVTLSDSLTPAGHSVSALTPDGRADAQFAATPAQQIARPPAASTRLDNGWRIDWMAPGGGVQSTVLFDGAGGAR